MAPVNAPFLVAEERALDELLGNGGQVHRDERCVRPARLAMDQPREQLLSGAALAEDEHGRRDLRDLLHQLHDGARAAAGADDELAIVLLGDLLA